MAYLVCTTGVLTPQGNVNGSYYFWIMRLWGENQVSELLSLLIRD